MARRRKKQSKKSGWSLFGSGKKPRRKSKSKGFGFYRATLTIIGVLCAVAVIAIGFVYLEKYAVNVSPTSYRVGNLELINYPDWISNELLEKIADTAGGDGFMLNEESAKAVAQNLAYLPWLYDVQVQTTDKTLQIRAKYRKPAALVKLSRLESYYLARCAQDDPLYNSDYKGVIVLDVVDMNKLAIVEITGFSTRKLGQAGSVCNEEDIVSAVELLAALGRMDGVSTPEKPLLLEIQSVDVKNFGGRKNLREPHVILWAKDRTKIIWGAAFGQSQKYLEATEKEKVAALYTEYKENDTVQYLSKSIGQGIDLRHPKRIFPRPTD